MSKRPPRIEEERGASIVVHPDYLDALRQGLARKGLGSLREIAAAAGVSHTTVGRFFGSSAKAPDPTEIVARRLCALADIPYPIVSLHAPSEYEWIELGRQCRVALPTLCDEILVALRQALSGRMELTTALSRLRRHDRTV